MMEYWIEIKGRGNKYFLKDNFTLKEGDIFEDFIEMLKYIRQQKKSHEYISKTQAIFTGISELEQRFISNILRSH